MIKVRLVEPSESGKWDDYINYHHEASPYHAFAWKIAIEQAYGHKTYYFLAEKDHNVVGVLPAVQLRFPFLLNELVALPYCDLGGCLYDNQEALNALIGAVIELGRTIKTDIIKLRGTISSTTTLSGLLIKEHHDKVRMLMELPESSEVLLKQFTSKLRSQIRKAEKNILTFRWGEEQDIDEYYSVFSENMRDLGSPVHSRAFFCAILQHFKGRAKLGLVSFHGKPIGAGLILMIDRVVAIPWASTLRRYNQLSPNMLLYWNFLKYAADNGHKIFDFGRSSRGEGTYRFKLQWGAYAVPLDWYTTRQHSGTLFPKAAEGAQLGTRENISKLWQKMPLPIANFVGPILRKYISL